jgi:hypothetical protein
MPDPCCVYRLSSLPRLPWRLASAANVQICLDHASWDRNAVAFLLTWKILGARIFWANDSRTRSGYHGYSRSVPGGIPDLEMPRQNGTIQYQCCLISRNVLRLSRRWLPPIVCYLFPRYRKIDLPPVMASSLLLHGYVRLHAFKLYLPQVGLVYYAKGRKTASPASIIWKVAEA